MLFGLAGRRQPKNYELRRFAHLLEEHLIQPLANPESGDPDHVARAEFIRVQCATAALPSDVA